MGAPCDVLPMGHARDHHQHAVTPLGGQTATGGVLAVPSDVMPPPLSVR